MSTQAALAMLVVGLLIVAGLAYYAHTLRLQVKAREQEQQAVVDKAREKTLENIHFISQALLEEQVDVMEACLRIRVLIDIIEPEWFELPELKVFSEISRRGDHLATHQARKDLPKQERMKQDVERMALEAEYQDAALAGARWLLKQKA